MRSWRYIFLLSWQVLWLVYAVLILIAGYLAFGLWHEGERRSPYNPYYRADFLKRALEHRDIMALLPLDLQAPCQERGFTTKIQWCIDIGHAPYSWRCFLRTGSWDCATVFVHARMADHPAWAKAVAETLRNPCASLPGPDEWRALPYEGWWRAAWRQAGCGQNPPPTRPVLLIFDDEKKRLNYQILLRPEGWPLSGRGVTEYGLRPARLAPLIEAMR